MNTNLHQTFDEKPVHKTALVDPRLLLARPKSDLPEQLVCATVNKPNSDEQIVPSLVSTFKDLANLPTTGVIYFERSPEGAKLRSIFLEHADSIGVQPLVLKGYPDVEVDPTFDQATWSLDSVSYSELVAEVVAERRVNTMMSEQAGARPKPVKRENALVKDRKTHFDVFDQSNAGDGEIDDAAATRVGEQ